MSRNKHQTNHLNGISLQYMKEELNYIKKCPRRSCQGMLVEVWVRYENKGPINKESECCQCSKVVKDLRYKEERDKIWFLRKWKKE